MSIDAEVRAAVGDFTLDVQLHVDDGEMLAVLGPNGAGKTTLLRAIAGLLPLEAGRIVVDGVTVDDPAAGRFVPPELRSIGVVFQDYLLFAHLSALDNVAFGLRERGTRRSAARAKARGLLDDVGMKDRYGARPSELSGGQAQRVALARALAVEPAVLLLDEPLAALDVQVRVDTRHQLREALARFGGARMLVTHDAIDALTLADRLLILERGRVVQMGTPDGVLEQPRSPYVAELAGVNLYRGVADGDRIKIGDEHPQVLVAADAHRGPVLAVIPPNAVVVSRQEPHSSARNVWPGTVATMERSAGRVRVRVSGVMPIVAEITPAAVGALGLAEGAPVWVSVKATEVTIHPD